MDYGALSLEERMQKAREYALLLSQEELPVANIPQQLEQMFLLTPVQAEEAVRTMKQQFSKEYRSARNSQMVKLAAGALACLAAALLYFIMGKEVGGFFYVFTVVFGLGLVAVLVAAGGMLDEQYFRGAFTRGFQRKGRSGKDEGHWTATAFFLSLVVTLIMLAAYAGGEDIYPPGSLTRLPLILSGAPEQRSTSGKGKYTYAYLPQLQYRADIRFRKKYYSWGDPLALYNLGAGTRVELLVPNDEAQELRDGDKVVDVVNMEIDGRPFYDLDARNRYELAAQEERLGYSLIALLASSLVCFFRFRYFYNNPDERW